jgi:hypothetical protein
VAYYDRALSAHAFVDRHKIGVARDNPSLERGNSEFNTEGPSTDPVAPRNNGLYAPGKTPRASFTCSDPDDLPGDSDVATCTATVDGNPIADGAPLPDSIGTHVFVVTAIDKGGNEYVHPHTYMVKTFSQIYGHDLPLAYYRLGDGSGQPMVDASTNGHNGEYKNDQDSGPTGIAGDGDKARDFFGAGGYGFVNGIAAPRFQSTLEAWVKPFDGRNQSILGHGDAGEIYMRDGSFHFRHMGSTVTSSMPARPGEWQQVVGTWDGVEIRIFVDGIEAGKTEATKRPSSISTFYVGFGELAPWFRGAIDEVAYYGVALPAARVYQHWLADPPPDDTAASTPEVPVPGEVTKPSEPSERPTPVTVPRDDPAAPDGPTTDPVEDKPGAKSEARSRKHRAKVKKCRTIKKKARRKDCLKRLR